MSLKRCYERFKSVNAHSKLTRTNNLYKTKYHELDNQQSDP